MRTCTHMHVYARGMRVAYARQARQHKHLCPEHLVPCMPTSLLPRWRAGAAKRLSGRPSAAQRRAYHTTHRTAAKPSQPSNTETQHATQRAAPAPDSCQHAPPCNPAAARLTASASVRHQPWGLNMAARALKVQEAPELGELPMLLTRTACMPGCHRTAGLAAWTSAPAPLRPPPSSPPMFTHAARHTTLAEVVQLPCSTATSCSRPSSTLKAAVRQP